MGIDTSTDLQVRGVVMRMSTLLAAGIALAATPALSQGAMGPGPGAAPMAPQPRIAPAAPAPVMAPQMPVAPVAPTAIPTPVTANPGTPNPGTTQPTGGPAGLKGTTAVVGLLALQADNTSSSIFDRWGNLFVEQKGSRAAPNLAIVSTDRARGSVAQTTTDQKGLFKVASTPGVHEFTLPARDIETAYAGVAGGPNGSPTPQAIHGTTAIVAILAFKVPGATTGGGRQDFGLARAIPRGAPAMQVKLAVNGDGTVSTIDWGDGGGPQSVSREGKPIGANNGTGEIAGRTLFVGEALKR